MSGLAIDSVTKDLKVTNNKLTFTSGAEANAQRISSKLRLFLGEWFLARDKGVPWIQQILVKKPNPTVVDSVLKREIILDPSTRELRKFDTDIDSVTRKFTLDVDILTDAGPIDFSIEQPV